nr:SMP-30/gluconolactonase/LRE family protein [Antrihabitans stalactiti]
MEAPTPMPDGSLVFANTTMGGVYRLTGDTAELVVPRRRGIGGIAVHEAGGFVVSGRDLAYARDTDVHSLLAPDGAAGLNDLTVASDGSVVVGVLRHYPTKGEPAGPTEVLRLDAAGDVTTVASDLLWPNGMGFSPDGETLYVAEYAASRIRAVRGSRSDIFASAPRGECDGLAVDAEGGVWVALGSGAGVARFTPDGQLSEVLDIPEAFVSSVAFGSGGLFVTTIGAVLFADVGIEGLPRPLARVPVS